jgi:hypothetical protein
MHRATRPSKIAPRRKPPTPNPTRAAHTHRVVRREHGPGLGWRRRRAVHQRPRILPGERGPAFFEAPTLARQHPHTQCMRAHQATLKPPWLRCVELRVRSVGCCVGPKTTSTPAAANQRRAARGRTTPAGRMGGPCTQTAWAPSRSRQEAVSETRREMEAAACMRGAWATPSCLARGGSTPRGQAVRGWFGSTRESCSQGIYEGPQPKASIHLCMSTQLHLRPRVIANEGRLGGGLCFQDVGRVAVTARWVRMEEC